MLPRNRWLVLTIASSVLSATATENLWIVNAYPLVAAGLLLGLGGWATGWATRGSSCRIWSCSGSHRRRRPSLRHPAP